MAEKTKTETTTETKTETKKAAAEPSADEFRDHGAEGVPSADIAKGTTVGVSGYTAEELQERAAGQSPTGPAGGENAPNVKK